MTNYPDVGLGSLFLTLCVHNVERHEVSLASPPGVIQKLPMSVRPLDERIGQFKDVEDQIRARWNALSPVLDERRSRLWAAAEAQTVGLGGIAVVIRATGLSRARITLGQRELKELEANPPTEKPQYQRIRRSGGGRKRLTETDPTLLSDLESLVDPVTRGDPESPLRWTSKSLVKLADELWTKGHALGPTTVGQLLGELGYSLQANKKTTEGRQHPDRNEQFEHINAQAQAFLDRGQPVISVDTKKKELVGDFKNAGRDWQPKGKPVPVRVHDFPDRELGKAIPYGVYDTGRNEGWVNVGIDHDTPEFAVESIARWWRMMGRKAYPEAREVLITADGGGSNSYRARLWKVALQDFADSSGLTVTVSHFPPGTSKWNKIEHRLFSQISQNWRGRPLINHETIVSLIGSTTNGSGLKVRAALDTRSYPTGIKVTKAELGNVNLDVDEFHGEWNYTIGPRAPNWR